MSKRIDIELMRADARRQRITGSEPVWSRGNKKRALLSALGLALSAVTSPVWATSYTSTVNMSSTPTLTAADTVNPAGGNSIGVSASGAGVVGTITGTVIGTAANPISYGNPGSTSNHAVSAVSGGKITLNGATIYAAGFGEISNQANSVLIDNNSTINMGSSTMLGNAGASAQNTGAMSLTGTTINLLNANTTGLTVFTSGVITGTNVTITGVASGARGIIADVGSITLGNSHVNISGGTALYTDTASGSIVMTGGNVAQTGAGNAAYAKSGTITLNNIIVTKDAGTALAADGSTGAATLNATSGTTVTVGSAGNNVASVGAYALGGGHLGLDSTTITVNGGDTGGANTTGIVVTGNSSMLQANSSTIDVSGAVAGATGIKGTANAGIQLTGTTIKTGDSMTGLSAATGASATARASAINVGANSTGISATGLGSTVTLANTSQVNAGSNSTIASATGGANLSLGNAQLMAVSGATQVTGIKADGLSSVSLDSGKVQTDAQGSGAVLTNGAGLTMNNTQITGGLVGVSANGANTSVSIQAGSNVRAAANGTAVGVTAGATANIGSSTVSAAANGTGLLADNSTITAIASAIQAGAGGVGVAAQNGGSVNLTNTNVTSAGKGIALGNGTSTVSFNGGALSAADTAIDTSGANSTVSFGNGALVTGTNALLNTHAGSTLTMNADNHSTLSGNITADSGTTANVNLTNGSTLNSTVSNVNQMSVASNSLWNVTGDSSVGSMTLNNATMAYVTDGTYKTVNVAGDFLGSGGTVVMNTFLNSGGSMSLQSTDRLLINGNVTGTTQVRVNGLGTGGQTGNTNTSGISLIQVAGSSTENAFALQGGYVAAGPYQYRLYAYGPGASNGAASAGQALVANAGSNWDYRLQNPTTCAPGTADCNGGTSSTSGGGSNPAPTPNPAPNTNSGNIHYAVAPQVPTYINLPTALMNAAYQNIDMLHNRLGELRAGNQNVPELAGNNSTGEAYVRVYGGHFDYKSDRSFMDYGYNSDQDYTAVQAGANLFTFRDNNNASTRAGVAFTYGNSKLHTDSPMDVEGFSDSRVDSYSLQGYLTRQWDNGAYIDGVLSYGWLNGNVSSYARSNVADVKGSTFAAGVEIGRPWHFADSWTLEPQAQLTYEYLDLNDQVDADGIKVQWGNNQQLIGRLGARLTRTYHTDNNQLVVPYAKVNLIQGFMNSGDAIIGGESFGLGKYGSAMQVGAGISGSLNKHLSLNVDAAWQSALSGNGFDGWRVDAGVRYDF